jgi:hypothetical protein
MHDQLAVPYFYVEWRFALKALQCGNPDETRSRFARSL